MYGRQHSIFNTVYYWFWVFCQFTSNIKPFLSYCIAINFSLFFLTALSIREIEFLSFVLESAKNFHMNGDAQTNETKEYIIRFSIFQPFVFSTIATQIKHNDKATIFWCRCKRHEKLYILLHAPDADEHRRREHFPIQLYFF